MVYAKNQPLFQFFATFEIVNIAASIISNLILIYLILYRSSREIGAYRYLLLAFAINDIYFPIVHFLTLPVICTYKDAFVMFSHGILTSRFSICLFGTAFSQTMPLLAHLFIYRLIATKWPRHLSFYTGRSCFFLVAFTLEVEVSLWLANSYYGYGSDEETRAYVKPFLDSEFPGEGEEFIGALYYREDGSYRWSAILATMGFNLMMTIFLSVIVFCSFAIVAHFRNTNVEWSGKTKKLQQQLFNTLVIQMIIPMIVVYFPCAGIINLPMLGFRMNVFPNLVSAALTIFPVIDAFIIMGGVKSYRKSILTFFKCTPQLMFHLNSTSGVPANERRSVVTIPRSLSGSSRR